MYTVPDAVAMLKPKRIIICYGTNNLSGSSTDATNYIKTYLQGLQAIQTAWPYCDIIVSAIPPLDRQRENTNLTRPRSMPTTPRSCRCARKTALSF